MDGDKGGAELGSDLTLGAIDWTGDRPCGGHCGGGDSCLLEKHPLCVSPAPVMFYNHVQAFAHQTQGGHVVGKKKGQAMCPEYAGDGCQGAL